MAIIAMNSYDFARVAIEGVLRKFNLAELSDEDKAAIKEELLEPHTRPADAGLRRISKAVWEGEVQNTLFRLGIVKADPVDFSPIRCEAIALAPVPAGKGKDPGLVQPPLFSQA